MLPERVASAMFIIESNLQPLKDQKVLALGGATTIELPRWLHDVGADKCTRLVVNDLRIKNIYPMRSLGVDQLCHQKILVDCNVASISFIKDW